MSAPAPAPLDREQIILQTYVDRYRQVFRARLITIVGLALAVAFSFSVPVAVIYLAVNLTTAGLYIWAVEHAGRHPGDPATRPVLYRRSEILAFLVSCPSVILALYVNAHAPQLHSECVLLILALIVAMGLQVHLTNLGFVAAVLPPIVGLVLATRPEVLGSPYPHLWGGVLFTVMALAGALRQKASDRQSALEAAELATRNAELETALTTAQDQTLRAETASRAKTDFLAVISHEVRTPLNAVLTMAAVLARESPVPRHAELASGIQSAGGMLLRLLNGVLDFVTMEAGKARLVLRPVDLATLLDGVSAVWRPTCDAAGLILKLDLDGDPDGLVVSTDADRIEQALVNLLSNAIKLSRVGDEVAIRVSATLQSPDRSQLRFEVLDRGPGVAPADRERIFEAFEQAEAGRHAGGAGLGLAICRRSIEQMGGRMGVVDRPGGGSVFWFELEAPVTGLAAAADADVVEWPSLPLRILAADDNPSNREVLKLLLGPLDVALDLVENGAEAVLAASAGAYDVILMDAKMPVMDGEAAVREIRAREARGGRRTPIAMVTANVFPDDVARYLGAGVDQVIAKPIDVQALYTCLAELTAPQDPEAEARPDQAAG
ncbi:MAG: ATP-binding protein [Phenylobacterium sp.]